MGQKPCSFNCFSRLFTPIPMQNFWGQYGNREVSQSSQPPLTTVIFFFFLWQDSKKDKEKVILASVSRGKLWDGWGLSTKRRWCQVGDKQKSKPPGVQGQIPLCFLGSLPSLNFPPLGHPAEITGNYFQWCSVGRREVNEFFYLPAWRSADGGLLATLGVFQGDCTESCAFQLGTAEFL